MPAAVALKRLHSHRRPQLADWRPEYAEETVMSVCSSLLNQRLSQTRPRALRVGPVLRDVSAIFENLCLVRARVSPIPTT
jgi:hypothetical protein